MKAKAVICIDTGEIFKSAREAERKLKLNHIDEVCSHKRSSAGGLWFEYLDYYLKNYII